MCTTMPGYSFLLGSRKGSWFLGLYKALLTMHIMMHFLLISCDIVHKDNIVNRGTGRAHLTEDVPNMSSLRLETKTPVWIYSKHI